MSHHHVPTDRPVSRSALRSARPAERPDRPGGAVCGFRRLDSRQGPTPGRPPRRLSGTSMPRAAPPSRPSPACTSQALAATPRRASPSWPSDARLARVSRSPAAPTSRRPSATSARRSARPTTTMMTRPHRQLFRGLGHLRRTAVPHPPAARQRRPGRGLRRARLRARPRGRSQADPRRPRRRPHQPVPLPDRGPDHRRARASRHRARLRSGHLRRRPPVLRHAVHPRRQPQGSDRPVSMQGGIRPARATSRSASCSADSWTSATPSIMPTRAA